MFTYPLKKAIDAGILLAEVFDLGGELVTSERGVRYITFDPNSEGLPKFKKRIGMEPSPAVEQKRGVPTAVQDDVKKEPQKNEKTPRRRGCGCGRRE